MKTTKPIFRKDYLTNAKYLMARDADYKTLNDLKSKFSAIPFTEDWSGDGNLAQHVSFSPKGKAKLNKDWLKKEGDVYLFEAIPSALALYRLCAFDSVQVTAYGQDAYKVIWTTALCHTPSGRVVYFGEHKGAFSFWTTNYTEDIKDKAFTKDLLAFLTYLVSQRFAHPYDGLVAGSVA